MCLRYNGGVYTNWSRGNYTRDSNAYGLVTTKSGGVVKEQLKKRKHLKMNKNLRKKKDDHLPAVLTTIVITSMSSRGQNIETTSDVAKSGGVPQPIPILQQLNSSVKPPTQQGRNLQ